MATRAPTRHLRTSEQEPISKCKEIRWFREKNRPRCTHRTPQNIFFENLEFQSSYDSQQISTAEFRFNDVLNIYWFGTTRRSLWDQGRQQYNNVMNSVCCSPNSIAGVSSIQLNCYIAIVHKSLFVKVIKHTVH